MWAVDYRMPPDHPFPAGLDDCLTVYEALLADHRPEEIIVGGASAGGNLAAALILRARDDGLPLPAAAVLMTPGVDLTASGDSLQTNRGLDPLIPDGSSPAFGMYAAGHDLTDPYVSPLYGDFTKGFPPTILTTGTRDMLLSDTVRMHRALRVGGHPRRPPRHRGGGPRWLLRHGARGPPARAGDPPVRGLALALGHRLIVRAPRRCRRRRILFSFTDNGPNVPPPGEA